MVEEWRPVVGYEGVYEISNQGRARSVDRYVKSKPGQRDSFRKGQILKPRPDVNGYLTYGLCKEARQKFKKAHRLVAEAFIEASDDPEKVYVLHWDDNPENNHIDNLRWGTLKENSQDMIRNGLNPRLNKTHCKNGHPYEPGSYTRLTNKNDQRACTPCKLEDAKRSRDKLRGEEPPEHGTITAFITYLCRCDECTEVGMAYRKEYYEKSKGVENERT